MICTVISLWLTNSPAGHDYNVGFWHHKILNGSIEYWINDGLMAIFFLMIGLELEREVYIGELSNFKQALLPLWRQWAVWSFRRIHLLFNHGTPTQAGAGIPMATDITRHRHPVLAGRWRAALKVFLTALAVIDDLGAILTIAIFYSGRSIGLTSAGLSGVWAILLVLNRLRVFNLVPYLVLGAVMWWLMLNSGVHATVTGVLVAFAIPSATVSPIPAFLEASAFPAQARGLHHYAVVVWQYLYRSRHRTGGVSFFHMNSTAHFHSFDGVGKPTGIGLFAPRDLATGLSCTSEGHHLEKVAWGGFLGRYRFHHEHLYRAFDDAEHILMSKTTILLSSLVAGCIGYFWLRSVLPHLPPEEAAEG